MLRSQAENILLEYAQYSNTSIAYGAWIPVGPYDRGNILTKIGAVEGTTPGVTLVLQTSSNGVDAHAYGSLTSITAADASTNLAAQAKGDLGSYVRIGYTITGTNTPKVTFGIKLDAKS